ncbi:ATP-binding protein [Ramlibacter sp.]|uniref:histidine kinase n=2 Tax=Ramlibacter aquaticus TaxID=2780094 RepID=A0ABR9SK51_9BURK|nr:ATP-binding protein [Ramlibacter sp.]MBE7942693.1 PAS domain S-box protein [Ramlibacter aquaticus]
MQAAPALADEPQRLQDLQAYGIVDVPAERVFTEVAELAATLCGTAWAAVSLVDEGRQWHMAEFGRHFEPRPRSHSVCGHGIAAQGLFEVPDTLADPRFADNPLLQAAPAVRFYGGSPLRSARGRVLGMLCVMDARPHRLSEVQKKSLGQLADLVMAVLDAGLRAREAAWFGALLDQVDDEILVLDPATLRYLHGNRAALAHSGLTLEQLRRVGPMELGGDPDTQRYAAYVQRLQAGERQLQFESTRRRTDGSHFPVEVRWQLLQTRGRPVVISHVHDITERRQVERVKSELVSVVNHELRTPLTSIHGAVRLLQQGAAGPLAPAVSQLVDLAADNSERLRRIVDDILDIEKIASGRMSFHIERVDAATALARAAAGVMPAATEAGVLLAQEAPAGLWLRADPQRLDQVLANLLSNAIKFSPPGATVQLAAAPAPGAGFVRLSVQDAGPGIPPAFHARIFQRFAQADMGDSRSKGGSGLGLSIARQMTEQMQGSVGFSTTPGRTIFHIDLPDDT